ncbi:MAG: acetate--CoA ligase family protein [Burkholderiales bacterium]|nr:acetate--CoA ligase family protein [Burkholderiales bacterium]
MTRPALNADDAPASLASLLSPRSIAIVGASDDPARPGHETLKALIALGYAGTVYPINPKYTELLGRPCFPSLDAVPGPVDLVVVAVPAAAVPGVMEQAARLKVRLAVVMSGGFRETGEAGAALQDTVVAIARAAGIRLIGPNCLGFANIPDRVCAAFGSISRVPRLEPGTVSLVTQSGGFGYSLALACAEESIGFRYVIATGNEADLGCVDLIDALLDDPGTGIVMTYLEGLPDARALMQVGRKALAMGKPLLVWKGGVTEQGARAAATHTGSIVGRADVYRALFRQSGIVELTEMSDAPDLIKSFQCHARYPGMGSGRNAAVIGGSGGSAIVFCDAASREGIELATFAPETVDKVAALLPPIGSPTNPVDLTAGYIGIRGPKAYADVIRAVLADPGVDTLCLNFASSSPAGTVNGAKFLVEMAPDISKPVFVFSSMHKSLALEAHAMLREIRMPVLPSPVRVAKAMGALATWATARAAASGSRLSANEGAGGGLLLQADGRMLDEVFSKALLRSIGVQTPGEVMVPADALGASTRLTHDIRGPYAVKIVSPDVAHKSDIGGVRLSVPEGRPLQQAIDAVAAACRDRAPHARLQGVLVSEMVTDGFEMLVGVVDEPAVGPVVVLGQGGVFAEAMSDSTCRVAPVDAVEARAMIDDLRCAPILRGTRGLPPLDIDALVDVLVRVSAFAWDHRGVLAELDINPLFVRPAGQGAVAADALLVTCVPTGQPH